MIAHQRYGERNGNVYLYRTLISLFLAILFALEASQYL